MSGEMGKLTMADLDKPARIRDLGKFAQGIVGKTAELEARIAALEERAGVVSRGAFKKGTQYEPGDVVNHAGNRWRASIKIKGVVPGDGNLWTKCR